jgi:cell division protein FtsW (lipid II flippase)
VAAVLGAIAALAVLATALLLVAATRGRYPDRKHGGGELVALVATILLLSCIGFLGRASSDSGDLTLGSAAEQGLVLVGGVAALFVALELAQRARLDPTLAQWLGIAAVVAAGALVVASDSVVGSAPPDFDLPGGIGGGQPAVLLAFVLVVVLAIVWTAPVEMSGAVLAFRIGWSAFAVIGLYAYSRDLGAALVLLTGLVGVVVAAELDWRRAATAAAAIPVLAAAGLAVVAWPGGYVLLERWRDPLAGTVEASDGAAAVGDQLGYAGLVIALGLLAVFIVQLAWLAGRAPRGFARSCAAGMVASLTCYAALAGLAEAAVMPSLGLGLPLVGNSRLLFVAVLGAAGIVVGASYRNVPAGAARPRWSAIAVPAGVALALLAVPLPAAVGQYSALPWQDAPPPSTTAPPVPPAPVPPPLPPFKEGARKALEQAVEKALELKDRRGAVAVLDPRSGEIGVNYSTENAPKATDIGTALGLMLAASATSEQIAGALAKPAASGCPKSIDDMIRSSCRPAFEGLVEQFTPKAVIATMKAFGFRTENDDLNGVRQAMGGKCGKAPVALPGWCASATALQMAKVIAAISTYDQPVDDSQCDAQPAPPTDADRVPRCEWRQEWGALDEARERVRKAMIETAGRYRMSDAGVALLRSGDNHRVWALAFAPVEQPTVAMAVVLEASRGPVNVLPKEAKTVATTVLTEARRLGWQHTPSRPCQPVTRRGNCGNR